MTAAGSRARSREIGYAEAMRDVSHVLWRLEDGYKAMAGQQFSPEWQAALALAAAELGKVREYAHDASMLYEVPGMDELTGFAWKPRPGEPVPAELPRRGQSDSN